MAERWNPSPFIRASAGLHFASLAALGFAPHWWPMVLSALVLDNLTLALAGMWPRSTLLGPNLVRLPLGADGSVALTFDDGPDPATTPTVLDLLDRYHAKATFFCVGRRVAAYPDLAGAIHERGHRIENHSFDHPHGFAFRGRAGLEREIVLAQDTIDRVVGRRPRLFRPPAGIRNPFLDPVLHRLGLSLVSWTRRGYDTVTRDPERVTRRLLRGLQPRDILLLHDGSAVRENGGCQVVLEVLPRVLDELVRRDLRSLPVDEAMACAREKTV